MRAVSVLVRVLVRARAWEEVPAPPLCFSPSLFLCVKLTFVLKNQIVNLLNVALVSLRELRWCGTELRVVCHCVDLSTCAPCGHSWSGGVMHVRRGAAGFRAGGRVHVQVGFKRHGCFKHGGCDWC